MMKTAASYNVTYHPILDSFPEYDSVERVPFPKALKMAFAWSMETAFHACVKPCIEVAYSTALDTFYADEDDEILTPGKGSLQPMFSRVIQYQVV